MFFGKFKKQNSDRAKTEEAQGMKDSEGDYENPLQPGANSSRAVYQGADAADFSRTAPSAPYSGTPEYGDSEYPRQQQTPGYASEEKPHGQLQGGSVPRDDGEYVPGSQYGTAASPRKAFAAQTTTQTTTQTTAAPSRSSSKKGVFGRHGSSSGGTAAQDVAEDHQGKKVFSLPNVLKSHRHQHQEEPEKVHAGGAEPEMQAATAPARSKNQGVSAGVPAGSATHSDAMAGAGAAAQRAAGPAMGIGSSAEYRARSAVPESQQAGSRAGDLTGKTGTSRKARDDAALASGYAGRSGDGLERNRAGTNMSGRGPAASEPAAYATMPSSGHELDYNPIDGEFPEGSQRYEHRGPASASSAAMKGPVAARELETRAAVHGHSPHAYNESYRGGYWAGYAAAKAGEAPAKFMSRGATAGGAGGYHGQDQPSHGQPRDQSQEISDDAAAGFGRTAGHSDVNAFGAAAGSSRATSGSHVTGSGISRDQQREAQYEYNDTQDPGTAAAMGVLGGTEEYGYGGAAEPSDRFANDEFGHETGVATGQSMAKSQGAEYDPAGYRQSLAAKVGPGSDEYPEAYGDDEYLASKGGGATGAAATGAGVGGLASVINKAGGAERIKSQADTALKSQAGQMAKGKGVEMAMSSKLGQGKAGELAGRAKDIPGAGKAVSSAQGAMGRNMASKLVTKTVVGGMVGGAVGSGAAGANAGDSGYADRSAADRSAAGRSGYNGVSQTVGSGGGYGDESQPPQYSSGQGRGDVSKDSYSSGATDRRLRQGSGFEGQQEGQWQGQGQGQGQGQEWQRQEWQSQREPLQEEHMGQATRDPMPRTYESGYQGGRDLAREGSHTSSNYYDSSEIAPSSEKYTTGEGSTTSKSVRREQAPVLKNSPSKKQDTSIPRLGFEGLFNHGKTASHGEDSGKKGGFARRFSLSRRKSSEPEEAELLEREPVESQQAPLSKSRTPKTSKSRKGSTAEQGGPRMRKKSVTGESMARPKKATNGASSAGQTMTASPTSPRAKRSMAPEPLPAGEPSSDESKRFSETFGNLPSLIDPRVPTYGWGAQSGPQTGGSGGSGGLATRESQSMGIPAPLASGNAPESHKVGEYLSSSTSGRGNAPGTASNVANDNGGNYVTTSGNTTLGRSLSVGSNENPAVGESRAAAAGRGVSGNVEEPMYSTGGGDRSYDRSAVPRGGVAGEEELPKGANGHTAKEDTGIFERIKNTILPGSEHTTTTA